MMAKSKGIIPIRFTEEGRATLCLVMSIINWICIGISLSLLGLGLYIKFAVEEYTNLVTDYDGNSLPYLLVSLGVLSAITNCAGGWIAFISGNPKKRMALRFVHFGYVVWTLCISVAVFAGGIMCFTHVSHLRESFHGGLTSAMALYKNGEVHKSEIDKLQMSFKCCGNTGYTDWFQIPWIHTDYLDIQSEEELIALEDAGGYRSDDAPFSCCSPRSHRPCVHHNVHDNAAHVNYDYREHVTLHSDGCQDALMNYFGDTILMNGGAIVLGIFVLQLMVAVVTRYLETSLTEAALGGDTTGPSYGYLINVGSKTENGDDLEKTPLTVDSEEAIYEDPEPGTPSKRKFSIVPGTNRRMSSASPICDSYNDIHGRRSSMSPRKMSTFSPGNERRSSVSPRKQSTYSPGHERRVSTAGHRMSTGSELRRLNTVYSVRGGDDASYANLPAVTGTGVPPPPPGPPPQPPPMRPTNQADSQAESCSVDGWGSDEWDEYTHDS